MREKTVSVKIDKDGPVAIPEDIDALRPELSVFEDWFYDKNGSRLTRYERSILLTYLGWKLTDEGGVRDSDT